MTHCSLIYFSSDMTDSENSSSSTWTVVILFFCLVGLIILLIFLYKKLNREADGEYTIRRMVYKEGGVRDQVRIATVALGTRLGVQLWHGGDSDKGGEEMQEIQDEEGEMERGGSQGSDSEEEEREEEDNEEQCGGTGRKDSGTSDDDIGSEAGETTRLTGQPEKAEDVEEKLEKERDGEGKAQSSRSAELSIDLKQFSGSAIWSEDQIGEVRDVTQL